MEDGLRLDMEKDDQETGSDIAAEATQESPPSLSAPETLPPPARKPKREEVRPQAEGISRAHPPKRDMPGS